MADAYLSLADIGTSREVLLSRPPRASRALVVVLAVLLAGTGVGLAFLPVQQTQTITGAVVAEDGSRALVAGRTGAISVVGAADGDTVGAGQMIITLDASGAHAQLAVATQEQASVAADLAGYQQLRAAVPGSGNPFDPVSQPALFQAIDRYRQELSQAGRVAAQMPQRQAATRTQAQAVLDANQATLTTVTARLGALTALIGSIQGGTAFTAGDPYAQALSRSWQAARPDAGPTRADYDAAFVTRLGAQVTDLQGLQTASATHAAQLTSQLGQPVVEAAADPAGAITADFLLAAATTEQQLLDHRATLALQAMDLQQQIDQAVIAAPIAGVVALTSDWQTGEVVQAGQDVARVVPPTSGIAVNALIPADVVAGLTPGQTIPCVIPHEPGGAFVPVHCRLDRLAADPTITAAGRLAHDATLRLTADGGLLGYGTSLPAGLSVTLTIPAQTTTGLRWLAWQLGLIETPS